jgi:hypothetical protein
MNVGVSRGWRPKSGSFGDGLGSIGSEERSKELTFPNDRLCHVSTVRGAAPILDHLRSQAPLHDTAAACSGWQRAVVMPTDGYLSASEVAALKLDAAEALSGLAAPLSTLALAPCRRRGSISGPALGRCSAFFMIFGERVQCGGFQGLKSSNARPCLSEYCIGQLLPCALNHGGFLFEAAGNALPSLIKSLVNDLQLCWTVGRVIYRERMHRVPPGANCVVALGPMVLKRIFKEPNLP